MANAGAKQLKAFTISFDDKAFDESEIAAGTASRLGVEHHPVRVTDRDIAANFLSSVWHSEIPIHNCNGIAKFLLSRSASKHVKAIMTGEGADELFAGYSYFSANIETPSHLSFQLVHWFRWLRSRQIAADFLSVPRKRDIVQLQRLFGSAPYLGLRALFYGRLLRWHLSRDFLSYFSPLRSLERVAQDLRKHDLERLTQVNLNRLLALRLDLPAYNLNYLADRQEMAHSIEGRLPFLDDEVFAFAAKLPDKALIWEGAGKMLIRRAFASRLPAETLASRKKGLVAPPTSTNEILNSDWARHLISKDVTNAVGIFDWKKLDLLVIGMKAVPAHSGLGSAMRSLAILAISVHALHSLFVGRCLQPSTTASDNSARA
jgi:asparagine synthase (glutamine-hydrolysing)